MQMTEASQRERCAQCKNSKFVLTEKQELPVCMLQRRLIWACLTGKDDRFIAKGDNND